jgi:hypothetical protein
MAGNAEEWVGDKYNAEYYKNSPCVVFVGEGDNKEGLLIERLYSNA